MGFLGWLKDTDRLIASDYAGSLRYFCLSPTRMSLTKTLFPVMAQRIYGTCLDAGAGRLAYKPILSRHAENYIGMDIAWHAGLDTAGSALALPFRDAAFESIFCSQVLEHVPDPRLAASEFYRCLKPGGTLVVSVPHLAYLHNEPHDYYRYTHYGIQAILEQAGFEVMQIVPAGGLLCFLMHIPSMIGKALLYRIPGIGQAVIAVNAWLSHVIVWLDAKLDPKKLYALNYIAIARKPGRMIES